MEQKIATKKICGETWTWYVSTRGPYASNNHRIAWFRSGVDALKAAVDEGATIEPDAEQSVRDFEEYDEDDDECEVFPW